MSFLKSNYVSFFKSKLFIVFSFVFIISGFLLFLSDSRLIPSVQDFFWSDELLFDIIIIEALSLLFLLLVGFIGIYNNFTTNRIEHYGLVFGLFGLVFGLQTGILLSLMSLRLRDTWRAILASTLGFGLGGVVMGLLVRLVNPTAGFQTYPILTWLVLILALAAPFALGGGALGYTYGRLGARAVGDEMVHISPDGTDVALTPFHVNRSKMFVRERFGSGLLEGMTKHLDADLVSSYIEMTRFPSPDEEMYKDTRGLGGLVRAADFIGQLGDPDYLRKTPALFYEFHELGINEKLGYKSPNDMRKNYASFYWNSVDDYIQDALVYLRLTESGKQWIANMHSHVFDSEHGMDKELSCFHTKVFPFRQHPCKYVLDHLIPISPNVLTGTFFVR